MDRLRAGAKRRLDDPVGIEVALRRRASADQVRLVGEANVERAAIGLRVDGDASDVELAERPEDPDRDLAPVRDEHLRERRHGRILALGELLAEAERCRGWAAARASGGPRLAVRRLSWRT
jgi:hypothetical protein